MDDEEHTCTTIVIPPRTALWIEVEDDFSKLVSNEDITNVELDIELLGGERIWLCHYLADHPVEDYDR
jgi:hypothetical protein